MNVSQGQAPATAEPHGRQAAEDLRRQVGALAEQRDRLSAAIEDVDALVLVVDGRGQIVRFNRACELMTGYAFREVRGKPVWELLGRPTEVRAVQAILAASLGTFPPQLTWEWLCKDGYLRKVVWTSSTVADLDGDVTHVVCIGLARRSGNEAVDDLDLWEPSTPIELRVYERAREKLASHPQFSSALRHIEQHYRENISLRDVAFAVGYSPGYLTNLVREVSGHTVQAWIIWHRMTEACRMLRETALPVEQIAGAVGYRESRHFSRQFRHFLGSSPGAWRATGRSRPNRPESGPDTSAEIGSADD